MLDPETLESVRRLIAERAKEDRELLDVLRTDARRLKDLSRVIRPRSVTAVSLVASDGGNNVLRFDPLLIQLVRVMDSKGKALCLDVISQRTPVEELNDRVLGEGDRNALCVLMKDLRVGSLWELSPMIPKPAVQRTRPDEVSPSWVRTYRDLCEWAVLYRLITRTTFGSDTLVVRDGLLRSKIFSKDLFVQMGRRIEQAIERHRREERSSVWLVGIAKHSKLVERYRLAMALEKTLEAGAPAYCPIPIEIARRVFQWEEYIRPPEEDVNDPGRSVLSEHVVLRTCLRGGW
jgi:hypothetical protein